MLQILNQLMKDKDKIISGFLKGIEIKGVDISPNSPNIKFNNSMVFITKELNITKNVPKESKVKLSLQNNTKEGQTNINKDENKP